MDRDEGGTSHPARSIEEGANDFLARNRAPEEIEVAWNDFIQRYGGEVWDRADLARRDRSIATIAIMSVLRDPHTLRVHVEAGLANGLTRAEIAELIMHTAVYAGVPQALRSMQIAWEVFEAVDARGEGEP